MVIFFDLVQEEKTVRLEAKHTESIADIKKRLESIEGVPPEFHLCLSRTEPLQTNKTLLDCGVKRESTLLVISQEMREIIRITVKTLTGKELDLALMHYSTVDDLQKIINVGTCFTTLPCSNLLGNLTF